MYTRSSATSDANTAKIQKLQKKDYGMKSASTAKIAVTHNMCLFFSEGLAVLHRHGVDNSARNSAHNIIYLPVLFSHTNHLFISFTRLLIIFTIFFFLSFLFLWTIFLSLLFILIIFLSFLLLFLLLQLKAYRAARVRVVVVITMAPMMQKIKKPIDMRKLMLPPVYPWEKREGGN